MNVNVISTKIISQNVLANAIVLYSVCLSTVFYCYVYIIWDTSNKRMTL